MNPNYASQIRCVDRFHFENNLHLLTMFNKKIDTLTQPLPSSPKNQIHKEKITSNRALNPQQYLQDPIKKLSKDKTKPIWDCITTFDPVVMYTECCASQNTQNFSYIVRIIKSFLSRYKTQHQDENSLTLNIIGIDVQKQAFKMKADTESKHNAIDNYFLTATQELFQSIIKLAKYSLLNNNFIMENERTQQNLNYSRIVLEATVQLLESIRNDDGSMANIWMQYMVFNKLVMKNLMKSLQIDLGPIAITLQPQLSYFPLLIHPLIGCLYMFIKIQIAECKRIEQEKLLKRNISLPPKQQTDFKQQSFIFDEMKSDTCSRFVFINFDGYETQFTIDLAKVLNKNLMYISFPKQSSSSTISQYQIQKSERLLRKYYHIGLSEEQKQYLLGAFKENQRLLKRNMYIFPIYCHYFKQKFGIKGIQNFQSAFIIFMMKQLLYNQILEFNPSAIIVSYSGHLLISNEDFAEIMKQLTVLGNYKVMIYPNISKNYLFDEIMHPKMKYGQIFVNRQYQIYHKNENRSKIIQKYGKINTDIFQKLQIAFKITSGTYNLNRSHQTQSYIKKYRNYKTMSYLADLIKIISNQNSNLNKMKLKIANYSTITKVLANVYKNKNDTYDLLFKKVLTKYHINLVKYVQKLYIGQENVTNDQEIIDMRKNIDIMQDSELKKQTWENFKFQYNIEVTTQKTQTHVLAHIPPYNKPKFYGKAPQNIISLEFQIVLDNQKVSTIQLSSNTSIYYSSQRKHQNALIYIHNHLRKKSQSYLTLYGIITPELDQKVQPRVQLKRVKFQGIQPLPFYQTYTQFNYYETQRYIFFFWPKIYDSAKMMMHRLHGTNYQPSTTSLIFRAKREQPSIINALKIRNQEVYNNIIPRTGCTCYEVLGTQTIYIFGGFYSHQKNHLEYQTDITIMHYGSQFEQNDIQDPLIQLQNIPTSFYFDLEEVITDKGLKRFVSKIKNDTILPKIQYEILPYEKKNGYESIFLIGGIGQNFVRPYSFITHLAHKLVFNTQDGSINQIKRIPMKTVFPINVKQPIKTRCPLNTFIVTSAQNRSINYIQGKINMQGNIISKSKVTYNPQLQKFDFSTQYEFGELDHYSYRQEVSVLKKSVLQTQNKINVFAKSYRGKQFICNSITLMTDNKKYVFQLQLQISMDAKKANPQLPAVVRLTGASLISIDICGSIIFALIRHPSYTMDKCVLAMYDTNQLTSKLIQGKNAAIELRQFHTFDQNVSQNRIVVGNSLIIAILHGRRFQPEIAIPQLMIVRTKKNQIKSFKIHPSQQIVQLDKKLTKIIGGGINTSFFIKKKNGIVLCFSFKTLQKSPQVEIVCIIIERLNMNVDNQYVWENIFVGEYNFIIDYQVFRKRQPLKLVELNIIDKQQNFNASILETDYNIFAFYHNKCLNGTINFSHPDKIVHFIPQAKTPNQYYDQISKGESQYNSIILQKHSNLYNQLNNEHMIDMQ